MCQQCPTYLYCPVYCTILHCSSLSLFFPVLPFNVLHCPLLSCNVQQCPLKYCPVLSYNVLYCSSLSFSVHFSPALSSSVLHFFYTAMSSGHSGQTCTKSTQPCRTYIKVITFFRCSEKITAIFNTVSSAAHQFPLCRSMPGPNPGLLRPWHWHSHALLSWLDPMDNYNQM